MISKNNFSYLKRVIKKANDSKGQETKTLIGILLKFLQISH